MERLINTGLLTLLAGAALSSAGCKRAARDDSNASAPKSVETTQPQSQAVLRGAKQAAEVGDHAGSYSTTEPTPPAQPNPESRFSWLKPGAWNSAPTSETPAASADAFETNEPADQATRTVENTAMLTVIQDAMLKVVSKTDIIVTSKDDKSFHMVKAKLSPDTKITRDGEAASLSDINVGDHVTVKYRMDHGQPIAEEIQILTTKEQR